MFITKAALPRRTFLRGMGVTIALPWLESMLPAATPLAQAAATPRTRLGCIYMPHGATMDKWTPAAEGSEFELSEILPHLGEVADEITLIRSMHTDQFNHHPGQLLMQCGRATFGLPTMGAWLNYGLGSESANLPGYVVLTAGRGSSDSL